MPLRRHLRAGSLTLGSFLLVLSASCSEPDITETGLGVIPAGIIEESFQSSPDSRHVAFIARQNGRQVLYIDGRAGEEFDEIGRVLLADNGRWAHAAIRDRQAFVVRDRRTSGPYERVGAMYLSADGRVLAYPVLEADRRRLVINGREQEWYDDIGPVVGSKDGRLLAYTALLDSQWYVVVGPERHGPFASLGMPVVAEDGSRWACAVEVGDSWALLDNGRLRPERYQRIFLLLLDPDSPGEAMVVTRDDRFMLVRNGRAGPGFEQIEEPVFSPDLAHHAFAAFERDSWRFVADGVAGPGFDAPAGPPVISESGAWAGVGTLDDRAVLFVSGVERSRHDRARVWAISPDGNRVGWTAVEHGSWYAFAGDEQYGPFAGIGKFELSPDGRRSALVANIGRSWVMLLDGERIGPFEAVVASPKFFSPDGRRVAWAVRRGDKQVLYLDGVERGPEYDGIRQVVFDRPDRVSFLALRGDSLFTVTVRGH